MLKKYKYTLLFVSWVMFITILSLFSFSSMDLDTGNLNVPYADKIVHFIFYFGFGFLGALCFRERTNGSLGLGKTILKHAFKMRKVSTDTHTHKRVII